MEVNENVQNEQMTDPAFDKISEVTALDKAMAEKAIDPLNAVLKKFLDEEKDFTVKHAMLALSRAMGYLTQVFCDDAEDFMSEMEKANTLAVEKLLPSLMPKMQDGKIIEENYDKGDLSLKRVLMSLACAVDYTFWRNEVAHYSEIRKQEEQVKEQA